MRDIDKRRHNKKMMKRACTGKIKYPDEGSAARAATALSHKNGEKYKPYKCRFGDHHHIGHLQKRSY